MKILLVNHLLDAVTGGGTAERTYQIGRFLAKEGVECTVLALNIGITSERRAGLGGAKLIALPCINERFFIPRLGMAQAMELVGNADIVHLSGHWTLLNAIVFNACRKLGKPYLFSPAGALKPFGRSRWLKYFYELLIGRHLVRSAAACVAITDAERANFYDYGVPADRVVVIPNGIDPEDYVLADPFTAMTEFREAIGVGDSPYILFLGRLNLIKGPDLLLEAFARLNTSFANVCLVLAGPDGGMLSQLKMAVTRLGLDGRVYFPGYLGGITKVSALHAATLLAIPSRREAMSMVVLEGGICDCPVLFTDACGLDQLARDCSGVMVESSVEAIADALERMLEEPGGTRLSAQRLKGKIQQEFLWEAQVRRYSMLHKELLGGSILP